MGREIKKGATDQSIEVYIIDSSDGTPETGVVYNSAGIDLKYRREGATVVSITEIDLTTPALDDAHEDGGFLAIGNGAYRLDLPDAALASGADSVVVFGTVTGMIVLPVTIQLVSHDPQDSVRLGLTALPNAVAEAAGGLFTRGTGAGQIKQSNNGEIDINQTRLLGVPSKMFSQYMGADGPGIFIDSGASNTNTVLGVDGTEDNPVSTFTASRTLADALGVKVYYLEGNSDSTLAATHTDWEFIGIGSVLDNIVNLGSQDVSRSLFRNLALEGTQGGSGRITARDCALQDPGAGDTKLHIFAERCGLVDRIQVDTSNDNVFDSCFSLVAGTAAPIIEATGAAGTISIRHYSGGIELESLSASHNVTVEGFGQVIFNANCNVNANVSVRMIGTITDNTAGMASLTQDALVNMSKIEVKQDIIDGVVDSILAKLNDNRVEPGQETPGSNIEPFEKLDFLYKWMRNKKDSDSTGENFYSDAGVVDQKRVHSDDGSIFTKEEMVSGP
jgi:hypothetical protein